MVAAEDAGVQRPAPGAGRDSQPAALAVTCRGPDDVVRSGWLTLEPLADGTVGAITDITITDVPVADPGSAAPPPNDVAAARGPARLSPRRRLAARTLGGAVDREELQLAYQPLVDLQSGQIAAVEAILAWHHPRLGWLGHDEVLSAGHDSGLEVALGRGLLAEAVRQAARWAADPDLPAAFGVHLTVTPAQLADAARGELVRLLDATPLPRGALCLQAPDTVVGAADDLTVAPSALLTAVVPGGAGGQPDRTRRAVQDLRDRGVRVGLTRVGTGATSLRDLLQDQVDLLRLDASLVAGIPEDSADSAIAATVAAMAAALGIPSVAAGVTNAAQVTALQAAGYRYAVGPLYSEPLAASDVLPACRRAAASATPRVTHADIHGRGHLAQQALAGHQHPGP